MAILKLEHKNVLNEVKVLIQNILFHCFTSLAVAINSGVYKHWD